MCEALYGAMDRGVLGTKIGTAFPIAIEGGKMEATLLPPGPLAWMLPFLQHVLEHSDLSIEPTRALKVARLVHSMQARVPVPEQLMCKLAAQALASAAVGRNIHVQCTVANLLPPAAYLTDALAAALHTSLAPRSKAHVHAGDQAAEHLLLALEQVARAYACGRGKSVPHAAAEAALRKTAEQPPVLRSIQLQVRLFC